MQLTQAALAAARTRPAGWLLRKVWRWIPHRKLMQIVRETRYWLALEHPQPSHKLHILLVPRQPFRDLQELSQAGAAIQEDLFSIVNELVEAFQLRSRGYRLVTNGGIYQEVKVLHFHLVSDA